MRNLGEYPVTDAEIIEALEKLSASLHEPGKVGDIRPTLLEAAIERIVQHPRPSKAIGVNKPYAIYAPKRETRSPRGS